MAWAANASADADADADGTFIPFAALGFKSKKSRRVKQNLLSLTPQRK